MAITDATFPTTLPTVANMPALPRRSVPEGMSPDDMLLRLQAEVIALATRLGTTTTVDKGFIPIPLHAWREITSDDITNAAGNGGVLATDTTPTLESINGATDKGLRMLWAAANIDQVAFSCPLPPDLDDTAAMTFHVYGEMAGATDTPTLGVAAFFGVGDTDAGGATGAFTDAVGTFSRAIAAGDVPAYPGSLSLRLTPGTHGTDAMVVYATWLEYTKAVPS